MTPDQHYEEAEALLERVVIGNESPLGARQATLLLAAAQVHATLAATPYRCKNGPVVVPD